MRTSKPTLLGATMGWLVVICQPVTVRAVETREIIASGDTVEGLGRIGTFGFTLLGLDARGRVLINGSISDGRVGIYWGDGAQVVPAWQSGEPSDEPVVLRPYTARTSPNGTIVALGAVEDPARAIVDVLYVIDGDHVRPTVRTGDHGPDGETFCSLALIGSASSTITDAGAVGFLAETVPAPVDCNSDERTWLWNAIYLLQDGATTTVAHVGDRAPAGWPFHRIEAIGVAANGSVIFQASGINADENAIFTASHGALRTVVADGTVGPLGTVLSAIAALGANPRGEVLFSATEGGVPGLYRTDRGQVRHITAATWTTPGGYDFWLQQGTPRSILNDRGDVALSIEWREPDGRVPSGVVVYPAGGGVELIHDAHDALLNAAGDLLFIDGQRRAVRRRAGTTTPIVANGDPAPGGGYFGVQGLSWVNCLSEDGLVATVAYNGREEEGFVCVDASGPHLVTRAGDPAPGGGRFSAITTCHFVSAAEIVFVGYIAEGDRNEQSLFRATPAGLEQIIAPGELYRFQVNRGGTIALVDSGAWKPSIVLLRRGEGALRVPLDAYPPPDGGRITEVSEMGLADNDAVIAAVTVHPDVGNQKKAIVAVAPDTLGVIATLEIPYPSAFDPRFSSLLVAGDWIAFHSLDSKGDEASWFARVGSAAPPYHVLPDQDAGVRRLTPGGRALVDAGGPFVLDQGVLYPLPMNDWNNFPPGVSEDLNDRGNVLFHSYDAWNGGSREALHLSGDAPTARCFVPPTSEPRPLPTLTPTPSRVPVGTPPPELDCAADPSACVQIQIGSADGAPRETVAVEVRLDTGPWTVAGVQVDLAFPPSGQIAADADGRPVCSVNEEIDKPATAFAFQPPECSRAGECTRLRAMVLSLTDVAPIADGAVLFHCDLAIDPAARPGTYPLNATNLGASSPDGSALPAVGVNGALVVGGTGESTTDGRGTDGALHDSTGGGCAMTPSPHCSVFSGSLLVALLLMIRRRARRSST